MYVVRDKLEVFIFKQEYGLTSPIFFSPKAIKFLLLFIVIERFLSLFCDKIQALWFACVLNFFQNRSELVKFHEWRWQVYGCALSWGRIWHPKETQDIELKVTHWDVNPTLPVHAHQNKWSIKSFKLYVQVYNSTVFLSCLRILKFKVVYLL